MKLPARNSQLCVPTLFLRFAVPVSAILSAFVVALALYGRLSGHPDLLFRVTQFGPWRNLTNVIWILPALALVFRFLTTLLPGRRIPKTEIPQILSAVLLIGTALLFNGLIADDSAGITEASQSEARSVGKMFLMAIDDPTLALDRMAARWSFRGGLPENEWKGDVAGMLAHFPGLFLYSRIDTSGHIRWVYPEKDGPKYLGRSVYDGPTKGVFFDRARAAKTLMFTKITTLRYGGIGFGALAPIWKDDVFNGALSFGINLEKFIQSAIEPGANRIIFFENGKPFYTLNPVAGIPPEQSEEYRRWRGEDTVEFRNLRWTVEVFPAAATVARHSSLLSIVALFVGVLLSLGASLLIDLYLKASEARAQARDALAWQEAIVNGSELAIISTDARGIVKSFNPAAERLLDYTAAEVCELVTPNLWHDPAEVIQRAEELSLASGKAVAPGFDTLVELSRNGKIDRHEWTFYRKDGARRAVATSVHTLAGEDSASDGFVWMIEDLTMKKAQDAKIAEQQALMLHSSKLASLGEMAAGMAHEINNPLLVISGKVEQVRRLYGSAKADEATVMKHMEGIRSTVDRIASIVSGLRSFARESGGEPLQNASLRGIVDETAVLCSERFRNHAIEFEITPVIESVVRCRPYQVAQVLLNLLNNAFDAAHVSAGARWVRLETREIDGMAEISVSDSGPGVHPSLREKIMMPFFTTKEIGKGTGLGLSISQGIMADHGGGLTLDATVPYTRFVVRLPLARERE